MSGNTSVRDSRTKPAVARLCSLKIDDLTINRLGRGGVLGQGKAAVNGNIMELT